jgi:putative methyltransferase (TIGR04325 family)
MRAFARRVKRYLSRPDGPLPGVICTGDYASWAEAMANCTGYSAPVIVERTCASLLKVKSGEAVFERDSVLFDAAEYSFPVLTGLLRVALINGGRLSVLDVGGSLGSSYFQFRKFLVPSTTLEWSVVEQPAHVSCGREHFESSELHFFDTIEECIARHRPNVLLLSGVLQCLEDPYGALDNFLAYRLPHVIIDRTAFLAADRDRLTVETVPEWIYPATYPSWFLSETKVTGAIAAARYSLVADFAGADQLAPPDEAAYFKGFIYDLAAAPIPV